MTDLGHPLCGETIKVGTAKEPLLWRKVTFVEYFGNYSMKVLNEVGLIETMPRDMLKERGISHA